MATALSPLSIESFSVLATALSLSIFMYWGWDTCLSCNEETTGSEHTPGLAAVLSLLILGTTYVLAAVAAEMYAGIGNEGVGLGNPDTTDNVFAALADPVMGGTLGLLLFLAVPGQLGLEPADHLRAGRPYDARDERVQGAS